MNIKGYDVIPTFTKYCDGNLALVLTGTDHIPYGNVTVNLPRSFMCEENCAFIDTNNMGEEIIKWLEKYNFGKPTGVFAGSGFCSYPEFEFNKDVIEKYGDE